MSRMWCTKYNRNKGDAKFFLICLAHEELSNHFKVNFLLQRHHNYTLTELDNMIPWEREVHTILLIQALEEEKQAREKASNGNYTG
jgi:hypothetical protein